MDGGGVLYDRKDPSHVAALMHALVSDGELADQVLDAQDGALDRLLKKDFAGLLLGFVERALRSPRKPQPPVTFDFWRQYKLAEDLAEVRFFRPSAYRALPVETGESVVAELEHRRE